MYLRIWLLIGLHGNQQSMYQSLNLLSFNYIYLCPLFFLGSDRFLLGFISSLPNLLGQNALLLLSSSLLLSSGFQILAETLNYCKSWLFCYLSHVGWWQIVYWISFALVTFLCQQPMGFHICRRIS